MYKKAAIATLIVAPLIVDLASRTVPGEAPPAVAEKAAPAPETQGTSMQTAPPPQAPPTPNAAQAGESLATMSTEPTLDTTPQMAAASSAEPAPPPVVSPMPALGSSQPAPPPAPFEPVPIGSEKQAPRF